ncbi:hypothetical protein HMPREF3182_00093 [Megasphaera hutchinsoni]|uniref:Uncharacterized protein n=1 Tax=Megasphaera hutchinsoni TaxID=1588748 RepID=A0A134CLX2_9FIRM|nr:hypothetical protein HMPREF3182_00093 [Megasphaera hutchinsoni]
MTAQAKDALAIVFMIQPRMPVSLTVSISRTDVIKERERAANGPKKKPLKVMITSFGEYVKKGSNKGMRMRATDSKAMAQHMPNNVT